MSVNVFGGTMLWTDHDDQRVASLDPLAADEVMSRVPQLNAVGDVGQIAIILGDLCRRTALHTRTHFEVLAIVRDLGMLAGSIRKHGQEPVALVPEIEATFLEAGRLTDLVPRDTLMHYTVWNPSGSRLRRYTPHPQEPDLIGSIRMSYPTIRDATRLLFEIRGFPLYGERTLRMIHKVAFCLKQFILGLHYAMRHVEPTVFIQEFRPFFEPFTVGTSVYRGPGAVTMPLHIFDFLLWGTSEQDLRYQRFTADYVPYNAPEFRQYFLRARNTPSLLDRMEAALSKPKTFLAAQTLITPVGICIKRLQAFRNAHLKFAVNAYHGGYRHSFSSGSGGHTTGDLSWLSELTGRHELRVEAMRQVFCQRSGHVKGYGEHGEAINLEWKQC